MTLPIIPSNSPTDAPVSAASGPKPGLLGLRRDELRARLSGLIDQPYRVEQVYRALHRQAVGSFDEMSTLPRSLRSELAERFDLGMPLLVARQEAGDDTEKFLFTLADGASIEAVDIPDGERRTLCISSQAGCAMACRFCVTGFWGAGRNLEPGEIVGQVLAIRRARSRDSAGLNLVFMGMGEPLLNLPAVRAALEILTEEISWRRITVSTVGLVPGIDELAGWPQRPNLAVSLHAPDDERRSALMPVNRSYPIDDLLASLRRFPLEPGRKLTFEYILIRDVNDSPADADALARRLRGLRAKINLIPINPDPVLGAAMVPPSDRTIDRFRDRLERAGWTTTVRRRRGDDVGAACGQLRAFARDPRGFRG